MSDLGGIFSSDHWYKGAIAAGVALAIGALAFHERDFALLGIGVGTIGFGEWINHPYRQSVGPGFTIERRSRRNSVVGIVVTALGVAIALAALLRVVI